MANGKVPTAIGGRLGRYAVAGAVLLGGLALLAITLLALLALTDPFDGPPHPSDAAMFEQFGRQRPALEALVGMIGQDGDIQRLALDFTRPEPAPITAERLADYRARLKAAGVAHGFAHYGDPIEFIVSTRGLAISGSGKSFVYAAQPHPDATVIDGDLDDAVDTLKDKDVLLQRRIDDNWWLQLDRR
jgi:hypothetical protein